jgi:hypothetical protein
LINNLELANDFAVSTGEQLTQSLGVSIFGQEPHAAVTEKCMATTGVEAERLVIRSTVVGAPRTSTGTTFGSFVLVDDLATVGWRTGNART